MAQPEFICGAGPFQANTDEPYRIASAGKLSDVGIAIVDIGGAKYFQWDGTATNTNVSNGLLLTRRSDISVTKTFRWTLSKELRIQGAFGAIGDEVVVLQFSSVIRLALVCQTDTSHFVWRVRNAGGTIGTGSTEFAVGTTFHSVRIETDGTTVTLEVDNTQEFTATDSTQISDGRIGLAVDPDLQNGQTINVRNLQICQSNTGTDRPDPDGMTGGSLTLTGDKVSAAYGIPTGPSCTDGSATEAHWDDWETGDADDTTSGNCNAGGAAAREVSDMSDPATTDLCGVQVWSRARAGTTGKTVAWDIILEDGAGNIRSEGQDNLGGNTFENFGNVGFGNGPGITGWTEAKLDDTGVGVRSPDTNTANDEHTAIMAEWFGIGAAAAPVAARPVAHSAALGSGNAGMF